MMYQIRMLSISINTLHITVHASESSTNPNEQIYSFPNNMEGNPTQTTDLVKLQQQNKELQQTISKLKIQLKDAIQVLEEIRQFNEEGAIKKLEEILQFHEENAIQELKEILQFPEKDTQEITELCNALKEIQQSYDTDQVTITELRNALKEIQQSHETDKVTITELRNALKEIPQETEELNGTIKTLTEENATLQYIVENNIRETRQSRTKLSSEIEKRTNLENENIIIQKELEETKINLQKEKEKFKFLRNICVVVMILGVVIGFGTTFYQISCVRRDAVIQSQGAKENGTRQTTNTGRATNRITTKRK